MMPSAHRVASRYLSAGLTFLKSRKWDLTRRTRRRDSKTIKASRRWTVLKSQDFPHESREIGYMFLTAWAPNKNEYAREWEWSIVVSYKNGRDTEVLERVTGKVKKPREVVVSAYQRTFDSSTLDPLIDKARGVLKKWDVKMLERRLMETAEKAMGTLQSSLDEIEKNISSGQGAKVQKLLGAWEKRFEPQLIAAEQGDPKGAVKIRQRFEDLLSQAESLDVSEHDHEVQGLWDKAISAMNSAASGRNYREFASHMGIFSNYLEQLKEIDPDKARELQEHREKHGPDSRAF